MGIDIIMSVFISVLLGIGLGLPIAIILLGIWAMKHEEGIKEVQKEPPKQPSKKYEFRVLPDHLIQKGIDNKKKECITPLGSIYTWRRDKMEYYVRTIFGENETFDNLMRNGLIVSWKSVSGDREYEEFDRWLDKFELFYPYLIDVMGQEERDRRNKEGWPY